MKDSTLQVALPKSHSLSKACMKAGRGSRHKMSEAARFSIRHRVKLSFLKFLPMTAMTTTFPVTPRRKHRPRRATLTWSRIGVWVRLAAEVSFRVCILAFKQIQAVIFLLQVPSLKLTVKFLQCV